MSDTRSSKEQLNDEFKDIYESMTNPQKIRERRVKNKRKKKLEELKSDYGLY